MRWFEFLSIVLLTLSVLPGVSHFAFASEPASKAIPAATLSTDSELMNQVQRMLHEKQFEEAKTILYDFIEKKSEEKMPPFVENQTLYLFYNTDSEILFFQVLNKADPETALELRKKFYPWYFELDKKSPWKKISFVEPFLCRAYDYMAYISIELNQIDNAKRFLNKAIGVWPFFTAAHAQLAHVHILRNDFATAKQIAQDALDKYMMGDLENKARLLRHLGYIEIHEKQFDRAEDYYKQSLEIVPDHPSALANLEDIVRKRALQKFDSK